MIAQGALLGSFEAHERRMEIHVVKRLTACPGGMSRDPADDRRVQKIRVMKAMTTAEANTILMGVSASTS
jgi:hypothetical protein